MPKNSDNFKIQTMNISSNILHDAHHSEVGYIKFMFCPISGIESS